MITLTQYVGVHRTSPDWTIPRQFNAQKLLAACVELETEMIAAGVEFPDNPKTNSGVSGETMGGFRPQSCTQGATNSSHKEGMAVDRYDPENKIDAWLMADYKTNEAAGTTDQCALARHGLYIEHPDSTDTWSHWTTRAPGSGHRIFYP